MVKQRVRKHVRVGQERIESAFGECGKRIVSWRKNGEFARLVGQSGIQTCRLESGNERVKTA